MHAQACTCPLGSWSCLVEQVSDYARFFGLQDFPRNAGPRVERTRVRYCNIILRSTCQSRHGQVKPSNTPEGKIRFLVTVTIHENWVFMRYNVVVVAGNSGVGIAIDRTCTIAGLRDVHTCVRQSRRRRARGAAADAASACNA